MCAKVSMANWKCDITSFVKKIYHAYFKVKLGKLDEAFAFSIFFKMCV